MKKFILFMLMLSALVCMTACGKSDAAKKVDEQISAIGEVTLESGEAISEAEKAVEELKAEDRKQLDNRGDLKDARREYDELVLKAEAEAVEKKIDSIGEVSLETVDTINAVQKEYDALSDEVKAKVSNYEKLVKAAKAVEPLKKARADELLASMRLEEDRVRGMKFYYPGTMKFYSNGSWAADIRSFAIPYLGMDDSSCWLRLICNYTGDDWVFFKSMIFAVDGKQYTKTFDYFDIVRDNEAGDVWEYIDIEPTNADIEMLKAIAKSNETIVRFQGDDYSHDFTVSKEDKKAINDVITIYELLQ